MPEDKGQRALEMDVKDLLSNVIENHYHDFKSNVSAVPKIALTMKLQELIDNTKNGKYDNKYTT